MAFKFIVLCAALIVGTQAGGLLSPATYAPGPAIGVAYSAAPAVSHFTYSSPLVSYGTPYAAAAPAITSQSSNILRTYGNLGQISTYSKTIDTPFSSVQKSDVRVSNPGLKIAAAPALAYAAAPVAYAAAPAAISYSAAPAVSHFSYSSPIVSYGTPYTAAHAPAITSQSSNILRSYGNLGQISTYSKTIDTPFSSVQKSDVRVSNPGLKIAAAPALAYAAAPAAVTYSAAPAVSHFTYAGSYGLNYGW
ncbi:hypothetical protein PPYR_13642 [Photinus pyralis]|uniref:Pupal cuticle protein C1B n=1 Tax=Photinus pyralis TaxID=7054 RepID=A0A5N4A9M1_PHOPY|nr:pupal cuticle protein C1B-like [Photinus pyralis]KAB0794022.1 hypothetical protein PPYR_13642 [Photinus pyralis]